MTDKDKELWELYKLFLNKLVDRGIMTNDACEEALNRAKIALRTWQQRP